MRTFRPSRSDRSNGHHDLEKRILHYVACARMRLVCSDLEHIQHLLSIDLGMSVYIGRTWFTIVAVTRLTIQRIDRFHWYIILYSLIVASRSTYHEIPIVVT